MGILAHIRKDVKHVPHLPFNMNSDLRSTFQKVPLKAALASSDEIVKFLKHSIVHLELGLNRKVNTISV